MAAKKNFPLRIDPGLYEALERWAGEEFRSVNGHIEFLLRESLKRAGRLPDRKTGEERP
ncbi:Arc family DNA-binding protein [Paenibacillus rhizophilus]|uniref:Arc family DNA-binding protein n=1 Tax=Paenibacillus rhizophilus TaxID=1850366 RepID=A0A3N9PB35_9BACL|nr:Arc family DNA-binding protein [Paenibacillus rhizophilus]RQW12690.1 Arc family DNA-binding protein [Paenibacillus rhizophilus]